MGAQESEARCDEKAQATYAVRGGSWSLPFFAIPLERFHILDAAIVTSKRTTWCVRETLIQFFRCEALVVPHEFSACVCSRLYSEKQSSDWYYHRLKDGRRNSFAANQLLCILFVHARLRIVSLPRSWRFIPGDNFRTSGEVHVQCMTV